MDDSGDWLDYLSILEERASTGRIRSPTAHGILISSNIGYHHSELRNMEQEHGILN